jgi:hypothetical protein
MCLLDELINRLGGLLLMADRSLAFLLFLRWSFKGVYLL